MNKQEMEERIILLEKEVKDMNELLITFMNKLNDKISDKIKKTNVEGAYFEKGLF